MVEAVKVAVEKVAVETEVETVAVTAAAVTVGVGSAVAAMVAEAMVAGETEEEATVEEEKANRTENTPASRSRAKCETHQVAPMSHSRPPKDARRCRTGTQKDPLSQAPPSPARRNSQTWQNCNRPQTRQPTTGRASAVRTATDCGSAHS